MSELYEIMKHFRGSVNKSQIEEMVKQIDTDNSGSINIQGEHRLNKLFI